MDGNREVRPVLKYSCTALVGQNVSFMSYDSCILSFTECLKLWICKRRVSKFSNGYVMYGNYFTRELYYIL